MANWLQPHWLYPNRFYEVALQQSLNFPPSGFDHLQMFLHTANAIKNWMVGRPGNKTQSLHLRHEITCVCLFCLVSLSLWQTIILATAFFARRLKVVLAQDHKSLTGAMNNRSTNHLIGTSVSKPHTIVCSIAIFHNYTGKCGALWGERELCGVFVLHRQLNNCPFQSPSTQSAHIVNVYTGNETAIYRGRTV